MTLCRTLESIIINDKTVSAVMLFDKHCDKPRFEVSVSENGICNEVIKASARTWRKKYAEAVARIR